MNPRNFFAELKRRNVMPMDYADDSISPPDLRRRWELDPLRNDSRFQKKSWPVRSRRLSINNTERDIKRQKRELLLASRIRNDTVF